MSDGELPDDPFRAGRSDAFDDLAEMSLLWDLLRELPMSEAGLAVRALDIEDLQGLVFEQLITRRLRFDFGRDCCVSFERPEGGTADEKEDGSE